MPEGGTMEKSDDDDVMMMMHDDDEDEDGDDKNIRRKSRLFSDGNNLKKEKRVSAEREFCIQITEDKTRK